MYNVFIVDLTRWICCASVLHGISNYVCSADFWHVVIFRIFRHSLVRQVLHLLRFNRRILVSRIICIQSWWICLACASSRFLFCHSWAGFSPFSIILNDLDYEWEQNGIPGFAARFSVFLERKVVRIRKCRWRFWLYMENSPFSHFLPLLCLLRVCARLDIALVYNHN